MLVCPKRCHEMTWYSERWILRWIAAKWPVSHVAFLLTGMGLFLPSHPFFLACSGFPRSRISSTRPLAHLPLPLSLSMSIKLGGTFLGPNLFVLIFLVSLETLENKPRCHIYQWVAHPTHGAVCNHCDRMMDGYRRFDFPTWWTFLNRRWSGGLCS